MWLIDGSWGDQDHVPADECPWRSHGHNTMLLSHRPPRRPWRRLYELRCVSCTLVVPLPPIPRCYDRWFERAERGGRYANRRPW